MENGRWKPVALAAAVVGLFVAATFFDVGGSLRAARDWIAGLGAWGPAAFILIYVAATAAMVPGATLTLAAGGLFGSLLGVVYVNIAATIGAVLCFAVARYVARDAVYAWLAGKPRFQRLDVLTQSHGAAIVAVARLVPIFPYNLLNYGFGLTRVGFWTHAFWTWVCMIPATVMYVVGADAAARWLQGGEVDWRLVAIALGIFSALLLVGWFVRRRIVPNGDHENTAPEQPPTLE